MKHVKSFINIDERNLFLDKNWISPHVFLDKQNKTIDYEKRYIPLQYISSTQTGGQYIDLGCHLMENTDDIQIDIKFNITGHGKTGVQQSTLITSQPEVDPYPGFTLRISAKNFDRDVIETTLNTKWMCSKDWISYLEGGSKQRWCYKYMAPFASNSTNVITGGELCPVREIHEYSILLDQIPAAQVSNFSCHLFCALNSSNQPFRFIAADLYYLRFTKGTTIVRDLIPVLDKNRIPGLYDKVNRKFYRSQGDEDFIGGPKL